MFFGFYMFSLDFFLTFNNNVLSYFKQSEIIFSQNNSLIKDYFDSYNQDNLWNNNWLCIDQWIIEDTDCNYLSLYWFIPPNTRLDLGTYVITVDTDIEFIISWENLDWVNYRIIDITNWWEYSGTIFNNQIVSNIKAGSNVIVKLINNNHNRNQFFIKPINQEGFKQVVSENWVYSISSSFNIKYWKNYVLQNWLLNNLNLKQEMITYYDMDSIIWDSFVDFSSYWNNLSCYNIWTLDSCSSFQNWPSIDEWVSWKWIDLDGIDDYLNAWASSVLDFWSGSFSISLRIKPFTLNNNQTIIRNWLNDANYNWYKISLITWWNLDLKVWDWSWSYLVDYLSNNQIWNSWTHVVFTYSTIWVSKLFLNWQLDNTFNFTNNNVSLNNISNLIIWKGNVLEFYKWGLDEIKLFNVDLNEKQVLRLYNK